MHRFLSIFMSIAPQHRRYTYSHIFIYIDTGYRYVRVGSTGRGEGDRGIYLPTYTFTNNTQYVLMYIHNMNKYK